jgi:quercetin dioxygenase-like cupin family protein
MKRFAAAALLFTASSLLGQTTPDANSKPILQNSRVTVSRVEIPPHTTIDAGKHDRGLLTVIVGDKSRKSNLQPGATFYSPAGTVERTRYEGDLPLPAVAVEFASSPGAVERKKPAPSRYCNPGSRTACVAEKYLLCTAKMCVEEVTMGPGAVTTRHSHDTDHMIIAVTDYSLSDDVVGKGVVARAVKSGGVEYIPAGITHTLTNKSPGQVRFVVVVFR